MPRLPTELPEWLQVKYPNIESAYGIRLRLEKKLQEEKHMGNYKTKDMVYCRILGYLFHHTPTQEAIETLTYEVVSAKDDKSLLRFQSFHSSAYVLRGDFPARSLSICVVSSNKGRTSTPSAHASRPSFDKLADVKMERRLKITKLRRRRFLSTLFVS